ncbi:MAG: GvpL/GvpF family gas vesicle protein [Thiohalocapsa sp.]|nr:GvpL/GvpF family gas vesicle protein [Thiohalocapsa sp.]
MIPTGADRPAPHAPGPGPGTGSDNREAVYLYGFAAVASDAAGSGHARLPPGLPPDLPPDLPAVDEARPLRLQCHGGLIALTSRVCRADYEGEAGEANLADIAWVGPRALRHQAVLEAAQASTTIMPLPFGTLFSCESALEHEMLQRRDEIESVLRRLAGCVEWAVQGMLDRRAAVDVRVRQAIAAGRYVPAASPGRRHLEEQRLRRALERDLDDWANTAAAGLLESLRALSAGFVERRVQATGALAFNWAFLVPDAAAAAFHERLDTRRHALAEQGLDVACKGPWPAYSFVAPDS